MARKYLGDTLDVHSGGIDHIPVHHTNEIAQSEGVTGKPLANVWMHTNHILVTGEKISKSLGNSITLEDIAAKGYTPMDLRLLILESHYRTQSTFSWDALEAAHNRLRKIQAFADLRVQPLNHTAQGQALSTLGKHAPLKDNLLKALQDDLNTPEVLALLSEPIAQLTELGIADVDVDHFTSLINLIDAMLGLNLGSSEDISEMQKQILAERQTARDNKDWGRSDELRDQLNNQGITVRDTPHGQIWSRL
jgi:cysteinyl-tRNA synthetase